MPTDKQVIIHRTGNKAERSGETVRPWSGEARITLTILPLLLYNGCILYIDKAWVAVMIFFFFTYSFVVGVIGVPPIIKH